MKRPLPKIIKKIHRTAADLYTLLAAVPVLRWLWKNVVIKQQERSLRVGQVARCAQMKMQRNREAQKRQYEKVSLENVRLVASDQQQEL